MWVRLATAIVLALALAEAGAQTPIYKCLRGGRTVTYQDSPCPAQQTQLPFELADAITAEVHSKSGDDIAPAATAAQVPQSADGERDTSVHSRQAMPRNDQLEGESTPPDRVTVVIQTLSGLMFASVLVALVAWKTRKHPREQPDRQGVARGVRTRFSTAANIAQKLGRRRSSSAR